MPRVVILGGGVAGMSAAQELVQRGYDVVVLERRHNAGGKARSIRAVQTRLGSAPIHSDGTVWAPGEHGFRFFPGFYRHIVDTMQRIPVGSGSAADHLVSTTRVGITQYEQPLFSYPARFPRDPADAMSALQAVLRAFGPVTGLTPEDLATFGERLWQLLTMCPERRLAELESLEWWKFIGAEGRTAAFQKFLASGMTRSVVAAKAHKASTHTIGTILVQLLLTIVDPTAGSADRVLDGPTSDVWIDPWLDNLKKLGVDYNTHSIVQSLRVESGRVTGVRVLRDGRSTVVDGDHFLCALPIERAAPLMTPELIAIDGRLEGLRALADNVDWMNGIQIYLRKPRREVHGHVIHIDSEWALTSISQGQFWHPGAFGPYHDNEAEDVLSVDISDWESPGSTGKTAAECTREEIFTETMHQLERSLAGTADPLRPADVSSWFLDPDIRPDPDRPGRMVNEEPLLVNLVDTWRLRPDAVTAVPNLFLASDYVRTFTNLATMEGANEAARRAVNGILDADRYGGDRCEVWPLQEPAPFAPFVRYDQARFALGLPWDATLTYTAALALSASAPALSGVPPLFAALTPGTVAISKAAEPVLASVPELADPLRPVISVVGPLVNGARGGGSLIADPNASLLADGDPWSSAAERSGSAGEPSGSTAEPSSAAEPSGSAGEPWSSAAEPSGSAGAVSGPTGFLERARWYHERSLDELAAAIPQSEPARYLYDPIRELVRRPSKGLRPALLMATTAAYGGNPSNAVPSAAGLEMLHGAFLVHDDVEDESLMRRGAPTLQRLVGVPLAVNTGDAMNTLSMRLFRRNVDLLGPQTASRILDEVDRLLIESLEGQAIELGWIQDRWTEVSVDEYLLMVLKKTAWYSFIHPMRIGAIVARPDDEALDRFHRFGFLLGAAFQIQDDVLNLTGRPGTYGKEIGGDLWEGKRTLVVTHALGRLSPPGRRRLTDFLELPRARRLDREVAAIHDLLVSAGSVDWAAGQARALVSAAADELPVAYAGANPGPDLAFVRSLVDHVVLRSR